MRKILAAIVIVLTVPLETMLIVAQLKTQESIWRPGLNEVMLDCFLGAMLLISTGAAIHELGRRARTVADPFDEQDLKALRLIRDKCAVRSGMNYDRILCNTLDRSIDKRRADEKDSFLLWQIEQSNK
jgi:hypothetical protein